jgi:hypothetical protein
MPVADSGSLCRCGATGAVATGAGELGLEVLVLALGLPEGVHDLVEEVVDLVLVVPLAELRRLELLVQDVVCCEQCHRRHLFGRTGSSRWQSADHLGPP